MVLTEQEKEATELQRLEADSAYQWAQFQVENLARQQAMQKKHRRFQLLKEVNKLNAAKAAEIGVYDQTEEILETYFCEFS